MIIESLVLYSCIANKGCSESSTTYYATHPSLREYVEKNEKDMRKIFNPYVVEYVVPFVALSTNANYAVRITSNVSMNLNKDKIIINFKREW